ncbi:hypothetical protein C4J93_1358 [Pseudomonas sp. R2-37-08W]|uniref:hypothetical protein n=1 Tax=Pseudomonas sp. R2-37-08W TaxID=1173273 RepID=UPI000F55B7FE|nr:hypothetical protein [Pseudomonas sp. R2-37-08W]AZF09572.1 hypothetical protein C4J93_1358 [Pseudomonas sp. R2-37-08W]
MSQQEISAEHAISQLTNLVLALAYTQAADNPESAMQRIGAAVYACRNQGVGDYYPLEVFKKVFPGKNLPTIVD